ncbi:type VII secretion target [Mycobacterium sp. 236(2023)]|uniref:type VII secretion target n=1 Tax=Mycobacterium sp. 236(2023) TaxID=3038163 RepID=UPI00241585DB|nr:type VII secretion target [Mycobacterium sp. 236(2023)]MDG4664164.1 type VII secretion target [Mycobacterium sp. 236(2023)]
MFVSLSADTGLIRDYAAACSAHAERLQRAAAAMATAGGGSEAMFGAVGARFLGALARAGCDDADSIARLSTSLMAGRAAAMESADAYARADDDTGSRIAGSL